MFLSYRLFEAKNNNNIIITNLEMKTKIYLFFSELRRHNVSTCFIVNESYVYYYYYFLSARRSAVHFKLFDRHCAITGMQTTEGTISQHYTLYARATLYLILIHTYIALKYNMNLILIFFTIIV